MPLSPVQRRRWVRSAVIGLGVILVAASFIGVVRFLRWDAPGRILASVFDAGVRVHLALDAAGRTWRRDDPVSSLRAENARLEQEVARLADVDEENAFLRNISDLPARRERTTVDGSIFAYYAGAGARQMVLNRGARDGIVVDSIVTTESGVLIGFVDTVQERTSTVLVVGHPGIQITGRVRGTDVNGLVRLDAFGELVLDLIAKDEPLTEGLVVETSGLDSVPAGLRIGTVRTVDADRTTLFQIIRLDVAFSDERVSRVLVMLP